MRVAVLGAGYAGLTVACRLERSLPESTDLLVVDESDDHLVQHELHRVVRRPELAEAISVPLVDVLDRATVRRARVTDVDAEAGVAELETGGGTETLSYDVGVVCLGAETAFYGLPGVEAHAHPLKRLEHARAVREETLASGDGDAVVGGAGLSGVQVAGELAALSSEADLGLDVRLVEMADRVAPTFGETFAGALRRELEARDVTVDTGVAVEEADDETVHLEDGRALPADVFVWTGGIRGPGALGGERVPVAGDLQVSASTFVVGDAGDIVDADGEAVPASAQTAVREARVAAKNVLRLVNESRVSDEGAAGEPRRHAYEYDSPGWVVSVGDGAVAEVGGLVVSGEPAKVLKAVIGGSHLGSVGAVRQASELVREELGWPGADALPDAFDAIPGEYDPASLGELQSVLLGPAFDVSERLTHGKTVDLTALTRPTDSSYPGSPANVFERTVSNSLDALAALGWESADGSLEDGIEVGQESDDADGADDTDDGA